MTSIYNEELFTLARAAALLPRRRANRPTHTETLRRWANKGLRGVRLETASVGGTPCTSREALWRFFDRLAEARHSEDRRA